MLAGWGNTLITSTAEMCTKKKTQVEKDCSVAIRTNPPGCVPRGYQQKKDGNMAALRRSNNT